MQTEFEEKLFKLEIERIKEDHKRRMRNEWYFMFSYIVALIVMYLGAPYIGIGLILYSGARYLKG